MAAAFATSDDLNTFLSTAAAVDEDEVTRLLDRASELVEHWARAGYSVDEDGLPTNSDVAAALRDATCAQVEQWLEVGEENSIDGLAGTQVSVTGYSGPRAPSFADRGYIALSSFGLHLPGNYCGTVAR